MGAEELPARLWVQVHLGTAPQTELVCSRKVRIKLRAAGPTHRVFPIPCAFPFLILGCL